MFILSEMSADMLSRLATRVNKFLASVVPGLMYNIKIRI